MLCAHFAWGTKTSKWQSSFVCYEEYCCVPIFLSYSCNTQMTYCFDFDEIWYPKQSAHTELRDLVKMVNIMKLLGIRHMTA